MSKALTHSSTPQISSLKKWLIAFLPTILWASLIFILSAQSQLHGFEDTLTDFLLKKIAHMIVYAVLYFLLFQAILKTVTFKNKTFYWLVPLVLCLCYAISDEFHQSFVVGRFSSARDIGYDMLGSGIALLFQYEYI